MSKSILLADDSATIRKVIELTFSDTDFHVESVASGEQALAKLEVMRPDLVLADVVMPEPSGYELCRRIKSSERPVPVLLLAGTFEAFDHEQARECGADGCLLKPFESRTLLDRVASLLASRDAVGRAAVEPVSAEAAPLPEAPDAVEPPTDSGLPLTVVLPATAERSEDGSVLIDSETVDAIADAVVRRLSDDVVRQIAREVVPQVAEELVRQRIRELESEDS